MLGNIFGELAPLSWGGLIIINLAIQGEQGVSHFPSLEKKIRLLRLFLRRHDSVKTQRSEQRDLLQKILSVKSEIVQC